MKAILLAAGQGSRLRPLTDDRPKCMVEYQGIPIIDHILGTLRYCAIDDIAIVKGYKAEKLNRPKTRNYVNKEYASTNMVATLFCAEQELDGETIISYTDIIYRPRILKKLLNSNADIAITIDKDWRDLWEARMEDPLSDAETLKLDENNYVLELGKKPEGFADIQGQYMGLIKVSEKGAQQIKTHYQSLDREAVYDGKDFQNMYMTSFLQSLIDSGADVEAIPIYGGWLEIDCVDDLNYVLAPE